MYQWYLMASQSLVLLTLTAQSELLDTIMDICQSIQNYRRAGDVYSFQLKIIMPEGSLMQLQFPDESAPQ